MTDPAPTRLHELLYRLREEIPGYAWAQVIDLATGESLAGGAVDPAVDASVAAGAYAQMLRCNGEALDHLGVGADAAEDVLVALQSGYVLLRLLSTGHFLGVAVTRQGTPGYARVVLKKYESQIVTAIQSILDL
jgi:predicted regulator of Ras-like GTPase activity (Roadblock/LC7/MglB family)